METKICKKCGKELPVDKFYKNKSQKERMFMMRNAIIMSLMNALRYTGSSVDAPPP